MTYKLKVPVAQPDFGNGHGGNGHAGNGHSRPPKAITGRNLAHGRRTKTERAFLALDIARGDAVVVKPTLTQAAKLVGVNYDYAFKASRMTAADRLAVEAGQHAIYDRPPAAATVCDEQWQRMTGAERERWAHDHAIELWLALDAATAPQPATEEEVIGEEYDPFADLTDPDVLLPEGM
jgi:hypothetical protein